MEVAVYTTLTALWWMSSMTIFLPFLLLLKLNRRFRARYFAFLFERILKPVFEPRLTPLRKKAFALLMKEVKRDKNVPLKVLEIGMGSGANLDLYPENTQLTALDLNVSFDSYFKENKKKHPHITYERTVNCMAEDMKDIQDCQFDVVVSTYVLCSVHSVPDVIREVNRVLKCGGKFLFLEHVGFPSDNWGLTVQRFAAVLWQIYFDGCNLDRDVVQHISAVFQNVTFEKLFPSTVTFYVRPHVYGIASK